MIARQAWLAGARWARDRRASAGVPDDAAAATAFDAWWPTFRPSPRRIPDDAPSWWYGLGPAPGRRLYDRRGGLAENRALDTLPLDGGYAPPGEDQRGRFRRTVVTSNGDVYTIIAWWDRDEDDGGGSSCFVVRGDHAYSSEAMVDAFGRHFPWQAARLAAVSVSLVEVGGGAAGSDP